VDTSLHTLFLPAQEIDRGVVFIEVFEGKLGEISVVDMNESARDISKQLVSNSLYAKMRPGVVLNGQLLEERILLINDTPGFFGRIIYKKAGKIKARAIDGCAH